MKPETQQLFNSDAISTRRLKVVKALGILVLVVLLVIIILQNTEAVETRLLFATVTMPRALLLFVHLALGYVLGIITMLFMSGRGRRASQERARESNSP